MKKLSSLLTINFFLISAAFLAQQNNSASLLNKADSIYFSNPDSSYTLSCLAEDYAKKANDKTALAKAYLYKGRYFLLKSDLEEADVLVNKSLTLYKDVSDWNGLAYASKLKAILEKRLGNNKQATAYTEEAVSLYKKVNDTKGTVSGLLNLSLDYIDNKNTFYLGVIDNETKIKYNKLAKFNMQMCPYPFPLTLSAKEALSYGVPIMARKVGGSIDFIKEGINGFFINNEQDILNAWEQRNNIKQKDCYDSMLWTSEEKMIESFVSVFNQIIK